MAASIQERLNRHISKFPCVLIEQKDGLIYLLIEHWRYLRPRQQAPRILLGKGQISSNKFEYLTDEFPIVLKRTKFSTIT